MNAGWMKLMGYACLAVGGTVQAGGSMNSGTPNQAPNSAWPAQPGWPQAGAQNQGIPAWPQAPQAGWPPVAPWGMPPASVMPDVNNKEQEAFTQNLNQPGAMPWGGGFPGGYPPPSPWGAVPNQPAAQAQPGTNPWGQQAPPQSNSQVQPGTNPWMQQAPSQSNSQPHQRSGSGMGSGNRANPQQPRQYGYARQYSYQSNQQWQSPPSSTNYAPPSYGNPTNSNSANATSPWGNSGTNSDTGKDGPGYPPPGMGYPDWYPQDRLPTAEQNSGFSGMPSWGTDTSATNFGSNNNPGAVNMPNDPKNAQPWTGDFSSPVPWPSAGTGPAYFDSGKDYSKEVAKDKE